MNAALTRLTDKFDALASRERVLVACALLGGIMLLVWAAFIDPARLQTLQAERTRAAQQTQVQMLQAQMAALQAPGQSPEVQARAELAVLKKQIADMGERLAAMEGALVPPQRMAGLLESMIGGRSGLRLLGLRTLPVAPVLEKKEGAAKEVSGMTGGLYKHGVELRLEGGYVELADYLARLEKLPQKLLWSNASLSADKHPKLVLTLTVFTLSLDRAWLAF